MFYVIKITDELNKRNINFNSKFLYEISDFCEDKPTLDNLIYPEHDERYLRQCLYNLQEKADRGIITREEWDRIIYDISFDEYQNGKLI